MEPFLSISRAVFQSTPSVGRATQLQEHVQYLVYISIHALRGEGDTFQLKKLQIIQNFNPRPPWGGRQIKSY